MFTLCLIFSTIIVVQKIITVAEIDINVGESWTRIFERDSHKISKKFLQDI